MKKVFLILYSIFTLQTVSAFEDTVSGKLSTLVHVVISLVDFQIEKVDTVFGNRKEANDNTVPG